MNLKIDRTITAYGRIEWTTERGITEVRFTDYECDVPHYCVNSDNENGIFFEGEFSTIVSDVAEAFGEEEISEEEQTAILEQLNAAQAAFDQQYVPDTSITSQRLMEYQAERRDNRRKFLIDQITAGNVDPYVKLLREEFGESVRFSVEIVDEAA